MLLSRVCGMEVEVTRPGGPPPAVLKPAIERTAAEGEDGIGSAHGPEHAGPFQAWADDRLAAGLNDAGAHKQALGAEPGIALALCVAVEIFGPAVEVALYTAKWKAICSESQDD